MILRPFAILMTCLLFTSTGYSLNQCQLFGGGGPEGQPFRIWQRLYRSYIESSRFNAPLVVKTLSDLRTLPEDLSWKIPLGSIEKPLVGEVNWLFSVIAEHKQMVAVTAPGHPTIVGELVEGHMTQDQFGPEVYLSVLETRKRKPKQINFDPTKLYFFQFLAPRSKKLFAEQSDLEIFALAHRSLAPRVGPAIDALEQQNFVSLPAQAEDQLDVVSALAHLGLKIEMTQSSRRAQGLFLTFDYPHDRARHVFKYPDYEAESVTAVFIKDHLSEYLRSECRRALELYVQSIPYDRYEAQTWAEWRYRCTTAFEIRFDQPLRLEVF